MNGTLPFEVRQATRFERELKKLIRAHPEADDEYEAILPILGADPHNRTRRHPIKKLEGIRPGDGQYRIRMRRFRFRYDIDGRIVSLKSCSLRREDSY
jgi:mRNA-degrading endonuclease RelE of RelBE toxin-antitoxin system